MGFTRMDYTVVEGGGTTDICAALLSGILSRPLSLTFTPIPMGMSPGNATCMLEF